MIYRACVKILSPRANRTPKDAARNFLGEIFQKNQKISYAKIENYFEIKNFARVCPSKKVNHCDGPERDQAIAQGPAPIAPNALYIYIYDIYIYIYIYIDSLIEDR